MSSETLHLQASQRAQQLPDKAAQLPGNGHDRLVALESPGQQTRVATVQAVLGALLISSTIGLVIVHAGLVPTRISALGIELTPSNQAFFRYVIAGVVLYLTATFLINITSEIIAWGTLFKPLEIEELLAEVKAAHEKVASIKKNLETLRGGGEATSTKAETIDPTTLLRSFLRPAS